VIELRQRILKSGNVLLEYRELVCQLGENDFPDTSLPPKWSEWKSVPYVDEAGGPLNWEIRSGAVFFGERL